MPDKEKVLVVSTHPDDETLGCGGTILKHRFQGAQVHWLILTGAFMPAYSEKFIREQRAYIEKIKMFYGFRDVIMLNLPTTQLDSISRARLIERLEESLRKVSPSILYVNNGTDIHSDHRIGFECVMSAAKPMRTGPSLKKIYVYETLSETEQMPPLPGNAFIPNAYVDISKFIDKKIKALEIYRRELQPFPLPREKSAVSALARYRGASVGVAFAEAFMLIREVG